MVKNMKENFFIETNTPDISTTFANNGRLIRGENIWTYERDGKSAIALDPEAAVKAAEGYGEGIIVWKGGE